MRFTIRHLLWFTMLAGIACWWWLPSANDAKFIEHSSFFDIRDHKKPQRFESAESTVGYPWTERVNFEQFDVLLIPSVLDYYPNPHKYSIDWQTTLSQEPPRISCRAQGRLIWLLPFENPVDFDGLLVSVSKRANINQIGAMQFYLIDGSVAAGLLTLAVGNLFVGRRKMADQPILEIPISD